MTTSRTAAVQASACAVDSDPQGLGGLAVAVRRVGLAPVARALGVPGETIARILIGRGRAGSVALVRERWLDRHGQL